MSAAGRGKRSPTLLARISSLPCFPPMPGTACDQRHLPAQVKRQARLGRQNCIHRTVRKNRAAFLKKSGAKNF
jgi:hypothetical protein